MSVEADLLLVKQKVEQIEAQLSSKITYNQLSTLAGNGLAGSGATTLDVNVDNSTLEINLDTLRVKDGGITSAKILDGTIVAGDIANSTIVAANIANDTLTATQIAVDAIGSSELADNAVDTAAIAALAVTTAKITDANVTNAKLAADAVTPTGSIIAYSAPVGAPTSWLACDGSAVSRTTYSTLFTVLCPSIGTFTTTIASPAVITQTAHGLLEANAVYLTTTGALPTGLSANTRYFVKYLTVNTYNLSLTQGGANINTSGTQSGTHTSVRCPWGVGNGTTTFTLPDLQGRILAGVEATATRLTTANANDSNITSTVVGSTGGDQYPQVHTHIQNIHTHITDSIWSNVAGGTQVSLASGYWYNPVNAGVQGATATNQNWPLTPDPSGASGNVQPTAIIRYIIKT